MTYAQIPDLITGLARTDAIRRGDGSQIPADPNNTDWIEYLSWCAAGNSADPINAAKPRPREATGSQLYAVMTAQQTAAWDKAVSAQKLAYQAYWMAGYRDAMPESNPKIMRIAKAVGVELVALFDAVGTSS